MRILFRGISGLLIRASVCMVVLQFAGCTGKKHQPEPLVKLPGNYKLVFQDEFNGKSLDTLTWRHYNLGKRRNAVNLKKAILLNDNEELEIRNWTEISGPDTVHHSGMIELKKDLTFGYYESRMKFENEPGTWGGIWIMYHNFRNVGQEIDNPKDDGAEIDIVEFLPTNNRYACHNLHWNGYGKFHKKAGSGPRLNGKLEGFHVYSLLWTPEEYIFYIDGQESWRSDKGVSHAPENIILSAEIWDNPWTGGIPREGYATFENTKNIIYVDYVRVFQEK
jgi:beta-glucanase (GH16 family)